MPQRDPQRTAIPLAPAMTVFASGVLVAALAACRAEPDTVVSDQQRATPVEGPVQEAETAEAPVRIQAPEAPPVNRELTSSAMPIPTSVVIRPGHAPIRHGGAIMMPHDRRQTL